MKNRLTDLNNHLFSQLERLTSDNLTPEQVEAEVKRAAAIVDVADSIVVNARLQLDGMKMIAEHGDKLSKHLPAMSKSLGLIAIGNGNGNGESRE